ncbi:hypothetical protein P872_02665 [Rhodonellum psychrophilum GCM71 = DSM 17998]|uniref:Uncharacterized protein n=1 Tax=Rhodonellum psychrophilum GCM71 = DSM 17998 TaxID=1123057 RepID=U5C475_9BACT|nr:hypothetical protein P872_02665 [Rhodonellum psychrophilum GCM71 = DSM 17998]
MSCLVVMKGMLFLCLKPFQIQEKISNSSRRFLFKTRPKEYR